MAAFHCHIVSMVVVEHLLSRPATYSNSGYFDDFKLRVLTFKLYKYCRLENDCD